jgi:hypothetical protein
MKGLGFRLLVVPVALGAALGCTTYPVAQGVKMVSFEDNVVKGKSVGPITGEDCVWSVMGYKLGGRPTLDKAMAHARTQSGGGVLDSFKSDKNTTGANTIRYINNVSTENDGFNAGVVGKECLVVKGVGYL